jgi:hypothetical protein
MPRMFRKALQALSGTVKVDTLFAALIVGLLLYFGVTFFTGLGEHGPRRWRHSAVPPAPRFEEVMKAKVVEMLIQREPLRISPNLLRPTL